MPVSVVLPNVVSYNASVNLCEAGDHFYLPSRKKDEEFGDQHWMLFDVRPLEGVGRGLAVGEKRPRKLAAVQCHESLGDVRQSTADKSPRRFCENFI